MTPAEERLFAALQRGIPLCRRPFEALAAEEGMEEDEALAAIGRWREQGIVRRFGAVFDARRLGYRSALCAAAVQEGELEAAASALVPLKGVTHCYLREADDGSLLPNLWFTLSCPAEDFEAAAADVARRLSPRRVLFLPAARRYKVDVVFGGESRGRDERVEDDGPPPSLEERAAIGALQGDTEVRSDYFAAVADRLGVKEWDLLSRLEMWRRSGRLKRIALLPAHRAAGWTANGMCCWRIEGDTGDAGRALAARGEVTHCYERACEPDFPYNLFAMIHCRSREEAREGFAALRCTVDGTVGVPVPATMLVSTREFKKTSMTFFA